MSLTLLSMLVIAVHWIVSARTYRLVFGEGGYACDRARRLMRLLRSSNRFESRPILDRVARYLWRRRQIRERAFDSTPISHVHWFYQQDHL